MIGSLLAIRFYAHRPWPQALAFWAVYLIIGIFGIGIVTATIPFWFIGAFLSFLVFMGLAMYWLHLNPIISAVSFAISFVIDFTIMYGLSIASLTGGVHV